MGFEARQLCRARGSLRSLLFSGMNIPSSLRNSPAPSPAPFPSLNIPRLSCPNPLPEFLDYPHQCREFPLPLLRWMKTHGIPRSFPMECWWDRGPICALLVLQENQGMGISPPEAPSAPGKGRMWSEAAAPVDIGALSFKYSYSRWECGKNSPSIPKPGLRAEPKG